MKYLFIIFSLLPARQIKVIEPVYRVYIVYGQVTAIRHEQRPAAVKQKASISPGDVLMVGKGAEITLVDRDTNFYILNVPGSYQVRNLPFVFRKKAIEGLTSKYLKLLYNELFDPVANSEKDLTPSGVRRTSPGGTVFLSKIYPPDGYKSSTDQITFRWHKTSPSAHYLFFLTGGVNNDSTISSVDDTLVFIKLKKVVQGRPGIFHWIVRSRDGKDEDQIPNRFEIVTRENEQKETGRLISNVGKGGLNIQLKQIELLEGHGFIDEAARRYANLVKTNPGKEILQRSYSLFLKHYGLNQL